MDGTIRTLLGVLHILGLARNLIFVSKMDDASVKTMFENETCRMVQGAMVLLKGVRIGSLYKLLGSTISDGCNSSIVPEIGAEEGKIPSLWKNKLCCDIKDWGISERRAFEYYMFNVWLKVCPIARRILIFVNIAYMGHRIV
jgi:hypothetical protein